MALADVQTFDPRVSATLDRRGDRSTRVAFADRRSDDRAGAPPLGLPRSPAPRGRCARWCCPGSMRCWVPIRERRRARCRFRSRRRRRPNALALFNAIGAQFPIVPPKPTRRAPGAARQHRDSQAPAERATPSAFAFERPGPGTTIGNEFGCCAARHPRRREAKIRSRRRRSPGARCSASRCASRCSRERSGCCTTSRFRSRRATLLQAGGWLFVELDPAGADRADAARHRAPLRRAHARRSQRAAASRCSRPCCCRSGSRPPATTTTRWPKARSTTTASARSCTRPKR